MGGLWDYDELPDDELDKFKPSTPLYIIDESQSQSSGKRKRQKSRTNPAPPPAQSVAPEQEVFSLLSDSSEDEEDDLCGLALRKAPKASKPSPSYEALDLTDDFKPSNEDASVGGSLGPEILALVESVKEARRQLASTDDPLPEEEPLMPPPRPQHVHFTKIQARREEENLEAEARPPPSDAGPSSSNPGPDVADAPASPDEVVKVKLTCQCKFGKVQICIRPGDPFSKLLKAFKKHALKKGWTKSADQEMRMDFDGDPIGLEQTPDELEVETDDVVDLIWKIA
eukprot:gene10443-8396_t